MLHCVVLQCAVLHCAAPRFAALHIAQRSMGREIVWTGLSEMGQHELGRHWKGQHETVIDSCTPLCFVLQRQSCMRLQSNFANGRAILVLTLCKGKCRHFKTVL